MGKYEQALTYFQQSLELHGQLDRKKDVAIQLFSIAICYLVGGQYEQARENQQRSFLLFQNQAEQLWIAHNYSLSGSIYQTWGKYELAIAYYQQSRDLHEQLGQRRM
jgi:tetratricopeptide (TPR) repeat protein